MELRNSLNARLWYEMVSLHRNMRVAEKGGVVRNLTPTLSQWWVRERLSWVRSEWENAEAFGLITDRLEGFARNRET